MVGYAGFDMVFRVLGPIESGRTTLLAGPIDPPRRWGGCGPTVAVELCRLGERVGLISWLGSDPEGWEYRVYLETAGVECSGVVMGEGPTPRSYLFYDPAGVATCFYYPSGSARQLFNAAAAELVSRAQWAVFTVSPASLTESMLESVRTGGMRIAWNVKADPDAYPLELRRALAASADLICLNDQELAFLSEATGASSLRDLSDYGQSIVVLTKGAEGCEAVWPGGRISARVESVPVDDPTGVGDCFFAAFLHGLMHHKEIVVVAQESVERAARFLRERLIGARL